MAAWRFMHSGSACMMIGFRSDHACIMHKSETDWMHARGQPASARAWPAASGQLAGWRIDCWGTQSRHDMAPIAARQRWRRGRHALIILSHLPAALQAQAATAPAGPP